MESGGGLEEDCVGYEDVRAMEKEGVICGAARSMMNEREKGSVDQQVLRRVE